MRNKMLAKFFRERQETLKHSLPLGSYLLKPVQRILKYHLLLHEIENHLDKDTEGYDVVLDAIDTMQRVAWHINDMKRKHEHAVRLQAQQVGPCVLAVLPSQLLFNHRERSLFQEIQSLLTNWKGPDLTSYGELVLEGTFRLQRAKNERTLFLFDKLLLITKKRDDTFTYKAHILCGNLMLVEVIPKEPLSFSVFHYQNPKLQHTVQAKSQQDKRLWVLHLKRLILENHAAKIPAKAKQAILEMDAIHYPGFCYSPEGETKAFCGSKDGSAPYRLRRKSEPSSRSHKVLKTSETAQDIQKVSREEGSPQLTSAGPSPAQRNSQPSSSAIISVLRGGGAVRNIWTDHQIRQALFPSRRSPQENEEDEDDYQMFLPSFSSSDLNSARLCEDSTSSRPCSWHVGQVESSETPSSGHRYSSRRELQDDPKTEGRGGLTPFGSSIELTIDDIDHVYDNISYEDLKLMVAKREEAEAPPPKSARDSARPKSSPELAFSKRPAGPEKSPLQPRRDGVPPGREAWNQSSRELQVVEENVYDTIGLPDAPSQDFKCSSLKRPKRSTFLGLEADLGCCDSLRASVSQDSLQVSEDEAPYPPGPSDNDYLSLFYNSFGCNLSIADRSISDKLSEEVDEIWNDLENYIKKNESLHRLSLVSDLPPVESPYDVAASSLSPADLENPDPGADNADKTRSRVLLMARQYSQKIKKANQLLKVKSPELEQPPGSQLQKQVPRDLAAILEEKKQGGPAIGMSPALPFSFRGLGESRVLVLSILSTVRVLSPRCSFSQRDPRLTDAQMRPALHPPHLTSGRRLGLEGFLNPCPRSSDKGLSLYQMRRDSSPIKNKHQMAQYQGMFQKVTEFQLQADCFGVQMALEPVDHSSVSGPFLDMVGYYRHSLQEKISPESSSEPASVSPCWLAEAPEESSIWVDRDHFLCPPGFQSVDDVVIEWTDSPDFSVWALPLCQELALGVVRKEERPIHLLKLSSTFIELSSRGLQALGQTSACKSPNQGGHVGTWIGRCGDTALEIDISGLSLFNHSWPKRILCIYIMVLLMSLEMSVLRSETSVPGFSVIGKDVWISQLHVVLKGGPPVDIPRQWQWRAAWKQEVQEQSPGADSAGSSCLRAIKTGARIAEYSQLYDQIVFRETPFKTQKDGWASPQDSSNLSSASPSHTQHGSEDWLLHSTYSNGELADFCPRPEQDLKSKYPTLEINTKSTPRQLSAACSVPSLQTSEPLLGSMQRHSVVVSQPNKENSCQGHLYNSLGRKGISAKSQPYNRSQSSSSILVNKSADSINYPSEMGKKQPLSLHRSSRWESHQDLVPGIADSGQQGTEKHSDLTLQDSQKVLVVNRNLPLSAQIATQNYFSNFKETEGDEDDYVEIKSEEDEPISNKLGPYLTSYNDSDKLNDYLWKGPSPNQQNIVQSLREKFQCLSSSSFA
ncbi:hypothetical protein E2I00_014781 [Balaenoptera physalus]|uniref:Uncharacterized protein n=1 Tax=Balaenoptera physalus TaxID=9770 RepID=A0A643C663_BALPH|nr:hypothetical protein E2I00_014781 [Balaenoptera physalus]